MPSSRGTHMVDESRGLEPDTDEEAEPKDRRSLFSVVVATIVIVVIVLIFLMLRSCDSGEGASSTTGGGQSISSVKGLKPEPGSISVWVSDGSNIDSILLDGAIRTTDVVNMNGGRYVVAVSEGTESEAMRRLAKVAGVIDTGRVYGNGQAK